MSPVAEFASLASKMGKYKQSCDDVSNTMMYQRSENSSRLSSRLKISAIVVRPVKTELSQARGSSNLVGSRRSHTNSLSVQFIKTLT